MKNSFVSISHSGNNVLGAINPADLARISRKNILPPWLSYLEPAAVMVTQQQLLSRPGEEIKVCWRAYFIYVRDVKTKGNTLRLFLTEQRSTSTTHPM